MGTVLLPIPDLDFDPTEVAVSWLVLTHDGHRVIFATESGTPARADDIMLTGRGLDVWSAVPVMKRVAVVGRILRANADARRAYSQMLQSAEYQHPIAWRNATLDGIDALLLPGGQVKSRDLVHHVPGLDPRLGLWWIIARRGSGAVGLTRPVSAG